MPSSYSMVITTCSGKEEAERIAAWLVEQRIAGCVQMFAIASVYRWEGKMESAREWMLICKIKASDYEEVEAAIRSAHSFSTPEIIEIGIERGAEAYFRWLQDVTSRA
jgi:periplasmic divalent cation tolerance protein